MASRVSLAELASAGFILHSAEAAAIVVEVCRQHSSGLVHGIPSAHVIRLTPEGGIVAEGPITTDHPPVARAAQLLNDLLPPFDAPPPYRVPGGLRLVVARALGSLDLPPFESLDAFRTAVARFASANLVDITQKLYVSWERSLTPRALTISDVRRARRATGFSLEDISLVCGVRSELLREMEWGYLKNWRNDAMSRSWLAGYAKASGLDEKLVTSVVVPMLDEEMPYEPEAEEAALVVSNPEAFVPTPAIPPAPAPTRERHRTLTWALASAVTIALVAAVGTTMRPRPAAVEARIEESRPPEFVSTGPVPAEEMPGAILDARHEPPKPPSPRAVSLRQFRTASPAPVAKPHTAVNKRLPASGKPPSKPNFFKREVLRIVIR